MAVALDEDCDGLGDAELWAAIDSAAAARRVSPCTLKQPISRISPQQQQQQQHRPLVVELPPSPQLQVKSIVPCTARPQGRVDPQQDRACKQNLVICGQKRHFNGPDDSTARHQRRASLQDMTNIMPGSADRFEGNCWLQEAENCPANQATTTARVPWSNGVPSTAVFKHFQDAAMGVLEKGDYMLMHGKPFIKKSGWRKIAFFYNISFEIKEKNIEWDQNANVVRAEFVVRASMQSGRFSDGWGSCDVREKRFSKPNHDVPSTAETRAKTRACQDLVGIGEYKGDNW